MKLITKTGRGYEAETDIVCRRLLRYNGYQLKEDYDADNTEAKA